MKKEFQRERSRLSRGTCILLACWGFISPVMATGQPPRTSVIAGESLVQRRVTLRVDEQTIGELLPQLLPEARRKKGSDRGQPPPIRSLWLDGQVDADARVSLTEAGTPAAEIFLNVAEMNDLAVFPLPGVLVMGRPEWVDSTISRLPPLDPAADDVIAIRWPTGSTAAEVLALMLAAPAQGNRGATVSDLSSIVSNDGDSSSAVPTWLPHDIWASGNLIGVDRTLAVALLLARFRCALRPGTRLETLAGPRSTRPPDPGLGPYPMPPRACWTGLSCHHHCRSCWPIPPATRHSPCAPL